MRNRALLPSCDGRFHLSKHAPNAPEDDLEQVRSRRNETGFMDRQSKVQAAASVAAGRTEPILRCGPFRGYKCQRLSRTTDK